MAKRLFPVATFVIVISWLVAFGSIVAPMVLPAQEMTRERQNVDVVDRYYHAINKAIASSEFQELDKVLDREIVDLVTESSGDGARRTIEEHIRRVTRTAPESRLRWATRYEDTGMYRVTVSVEPASSAKLGGLLVGENSQIWPPVERLRISGDRIVEREYESVQIHYAETLVQQEIVFDGDRHRKLELNSVTMGPRFGFGLQSHTSSVLILVESDDLFISPIMSPVEVEIFESVRTGPDLSFDSTLVWLEERSPVRNGSLVIVPASARVTIINDGTRFAHLKVAAWPTTAVPEVNPDAQTMHDSPMLPAPPGVSGVHGLWGINDEQYEAATVSLSVVSLEPGTTVRSDPEATLVLPFSSSEEIQFLTIDAAPDSAISHSARSIGDDDMPPFRTSFGATDLPALLINSGSETETVWLLSIKSKKDSQR